MKYESKWDLDCFYSGGSNSNAFQEELNQLNSEIEKLALPSEVASCSPLIQKMQQIDASLRECDAFILCLQSQDIGDDRANQLRSAFYALEARFQLFNNRFDDFLRRCDDASFQSLIHNPACVDIRFVLEERRTRAKLKLPLEKEDLITQLSVDGYQAWGELYPLLVGEIKIPFKTDQLSFGQAENKMAHPSRHVREAVFSQLRDAWKEKEGLFAQVLNHIAGFRLQVYAQRGWTNPLQEPLFENRMSLKTLQAMWEAVCEFKKPLLGFMQAKARLLGVEKLCWFDLEAPLFEGKNEDISYQKGAELIIDSFEKFHPRMAEFARRALHQKWIEAEDRPKKRPGGFCIHFPKSRQSRIFMTYSDTMLNAATLVHELGHAYHTEMVDNLPSFAQHYRMNIAETASTFAEHVLSDAFLNRAKTREEKLKIFSDRIQRSIVFMMNIHTRFLFETQMYEARKTRFLSAQDLCALMQQSQETAYCGSLGQWHPYFWAAKMHFYFTDVPFYNFPYTFGYLFSLGIFIRAKKGGPSFMQKYDSLLRESGMMSIEDLAKKHIGVDLTKPDFWREASAAAVADVDTFLKLLEV